MVSAVPVLAQALSPAPVCAAGAKGIQHNPAKQGLCPVIPVHAVLLAEICSAVLTPPPPLLIRSSQDKCQLSFSAPEKVTKCGRKQQNMSSGSTEVRSKEKGLAEGLFRK